MVDKMQQGKKKATMWNNYTKRRKCLLTEVYQLKTGDSVIVICGKCKLLSFGHKVCMLCGARIPQKAKVKIIKRNNQIIIARRGEVLDLSEEDEKKLKLLLSPQQLTPSGITSGDVLDQSKEDKKQQDSVWRPPQLTSPGDVLDQSKEDKKQQDSVWRPPQLTSPCMTSGKVLDQSKEGNKQQESVLKPQQQSNLNKNQDGLQSCLNSVKDVDLECLDEEEFLNDNIIDFYLQYLYHKQFPQDIRERSHIFSTHFFSTLRTKWEDAEKKMKIEELESKKYFVSNNMWTKKLDLFSKDFLFIPIHKKRHWYLTVLCYLPEFIKKDHIHKPPSESPNAESNEKVPCLYYFDSLDDINTLADEKTISSVYLMEFLEILCNIKMPDVNCEWRQITVRKTDCPQQSNGYDCGIYVLHFVEKFFEIPLTPSFNFRRWFSREDVANKRTEVRNLIKNLQEEYSATNHHSSDSDVF